MIPRQHTRSFCSHVFAAVILWLLPVVAMAQDSMADVPPKARSWFEVWIYDGGIWMAPIGACLFATIALTVLCIITLQKTRFTPQPLVDALDGQMKGCRVRSAIDVASRSPSFLGRMMTVSMPHFDGTDHATLGREKVEDAMAEFATNELRPYQKWIGYFSVMAQICPMLGLFGTVVGMVGAFGTLKVKSTANPSDLAGDIAVALLTTWGGLAVAIPALFLFYVFRNRLNDLVGECVGAGTQLVETAVQAAHGDVKASKVPDGLN